MWEYRSIKKPTRIHCIFTALLDTLHGLRLMFCIHQRLYRILMFKRHFPINRTKNKTNKQANKQTSQNEMKKNEPCSDRQTPDWSRGTRAVGTQA